MRPFGFFSWLMFIVGIAGFVLGVGVLVSGDIENGASLVGSGVIGFLFYLVPALVRRSQTKASEQSAALLEIAQNSDTLELPCSLTITREESFVGVVVPLNVLVNGTVIGQIKNGESINAVAPRKNNVIQCPPGPSFAFEAQSGGSIRLSFTYGGKIRQV